MSNPDLDRKKMPLATMLAKVEDVLKRGKKTDAPAYTLILGAGASFGVVPTAKEMLGFPDAKTGKIHEKSIPIWLAKQLDSGATIGDDKARLECSKAFWKQFVADNAGNCGGIKIGGDGLPVSTSIAAAYQAVFDTSCIGGLDAPERHRSFMREVTMAAEPGSAQLNATHFYLASLLSLQRRPGELGSDKKPLYTGRREFARTIFTTNFDPLLQTSLQLFQLLYYMTDRPEFLPADALQTDQHPATHLFYAHGSVHRPYMANTDHQIAELKKQNARDLAAYLGSHGVIVLGYSGWDDCLLEALNQTRTYSNNLYWLARGSSSISHDVTKFLTSHSNAYWVEIDDGGSFMAELHHRLCPGAPNTEMLYNPIRPLLTQLKCVSLTGIRPRQIPADPDSGKSISSTEPPPEVDGVRLQVIRRLEDAQKLFTEPAKAETGWEELERQANLSYSNSDWDAALTAYNRLLNGAFTVPVNQKALALFRRGVCRRKEGAVEEAIADLTAVVELHEAPVELLAKARMNRGICYRLKDKMEDALADLSAVIESPGLSVERIASAHILRGFYYFAKGDTERAIDDFATVIELPDAPVEQVAIARLKRGSCYEQKGETDKAIVDYSAVIELPGAPVEKIAQARLNRALCYSKKGETEKGFADYSTVIELPGASTTQIAMARFNRGVDCGDKGKTEQAIADFSVVIELPGTPLERIARARFNRSLCYADKGETEKALADCEAVIGMPGAPAELIQTATQLKQELISRQKNESKPDGGTSS